MVGVIAAVAALLGAGVGSTATIVAAQDQVAGTISAAEAQVDGQTSQWIRDERKKLYVQVINKLDAAYKGFQGIDTRLVLAFRDGRLTPAMAQAARDEYDALADAVIQVNGEALLLFPEPTHDAYLTVVGELMKCSSKLFSLAQAMDRQLSDAEVRLLIDGLNDSPEKTNGDEKFLEAARADLGIP
ncbi:hypothetical protein [Nocardia sp. NPDC057668]|uniref:hypothetical protein n=1 Tax=Nocardia sp. NPDC057668 TaxID=3346202 RepID=UPI00366E830D